MRYDPDVACRSLPTHLFEGALGEQVTLDAAESFVRVVVCLLNQAQLLSLLLVETHRHRVQLLEALQSQHHQLGVMFVAQRRERDGRELARLEPVYGGGVDGNRLLRGDIGPILEVVVLALLLCLEP